MTTGLDRPASPARRSLLSGHPALVVLASFAALIAGGTVALRLPAAATGAEPVTWLDALFTATSAVSVTGLGVIDTASAWTPWGQATILLLIEVGGLGFVTLSSLAALAATRRLGVNLRRVVQAETGAVALGDVRRTVLAVVGITLVAQSLLATVLAARLALDHGYRPLSALWHGLFHAISAFNNAGFALHSDSLMGFAADPWILAGIGSAVIVGGIGFPVVLEVAQRRPTSLWSLHTKLVLTVTALLLVGGTIAFAALEWSNPATLGERGTAAKIGLSAFHAVMPRTAGFNALDYTAMTEPTWLITTVLMFIGGGSVSTAGGIKVTTFAVLACVVWSELRGDAYPTAFRRRIDPIVVRTAVTVLFLGATFVVAGALLVSAIGDIPLAAAVFEATSAFATVGLSTGITPDLPPAAQLVLVVLMFTGRVGPLTLGAALLLRDRPQRYRVPSERPFVG